MWQLRVNAGRDPVTDRPRVFTETFRGGKKAAQQRLAELVAQHSGRATGTEATLSTLLERYFATARIAQSTVGNYRTALNHLPARLLATPIDRIGAHDLDSLYSALAKKGVGGPRVRTIHAVLSSAFAQAVKWRWLPANPARDATPPPPNQRRTSPPDDAALGRILAAAGDDQILLWLRLAIVTGARRSEVLALRWQDVDFDAKRITIAGSLDIHRRRIPTKTGEVRRVAVDDATIAALRVQQRWARERALKVGDTINDASYLLSDHALSMVPWRPDLASKRFRRLCDTASLPTFRLHDLRHAAATRLLSSGVDLAVVSKRLGHSRSSTTLDVYSHVTAGGDERAAEVAAEGLDGRDAHHA